MHVRISDPSIFHAHEIVVVEVVVVVENVVEFVFCLVWCTIDRGWIGAVHTISLFLACD